MTEQRCLYCQYFGSDEANPEAEERALERRYGPEVALVGACQHPDHPATINSKWDCEDWTARNDASPASGLGTE
jgi:hypothetical protein